MQTNLDRQLTKQYTASVLNVDYFVEVHKGDEHFIDMVKVNIANQDLWVKYVSLQYNVRIGNIVLIKENYFDGVLINRTAIYDVDINREIQEEQIDPSFYITADEEQFDPSVDYDANTEMPE